MALTFITLSVPDYNRKLSTMTEEEMKEEFALLAEPVSRICTRRQALYDVLQPAAEERRAKQLLDQLSDAERRALIKAAQEAA